MSKLLNNLPIEDLTKDNDYLGIIEKGEIIKTFLESNTEEFNEIKMFALYGEWGSGKSTLMKYLQKELKGTFNAFFFEAWQYESDDNLSLSLLEYLSYETADSTDEALGEIVKVAAKLFRGFSKSMRISVPGLSIDGNKIVESLEDKPQETFYQLKMKFQKEFKSWENINTVKGKPEFNIVFIDDLDRCEPENVLNLLSALKLFFTYGEKTIFFCGVDKKAVNEAVKTKYNEIVKANEYLEKIFDITFQMPSDNDFRKLISQCFEPVTVGNYVDELDKEIAGFFYEIKFTNPRKLKKVLNKYLILKTLKNNLNEESSSRHLIPNITTDESGNFFEIIFTLYFLILNDFYKELLDDFYNLEKKKSIYKELANSNDTEIYDFDFNFHYVTFSEIQTSLKTNFNDSFTYLLKSFAPMNPIVIDSSRSFWDRESFEINFLVTQKKIDYYFTLYLSNKFEQIKKSSNFSDFTFFRFKQMIDKFL